MATADGEGECDPEAGGENEQPEESPTVPWHERLDIGGDFRARYEGFYQRQRAARNRMRLRLRLRVEAEINEDASFHLQVASGDPGTPASTNQTFADFFQPKPFNLDRAYVTYNPRGASAMSLGIGKFPAPFTRTQMTFDDDLNYEGGWEQVSWRPYSSVAVDLAAMQTVVNEESRGSDSYLLAGFGAVTFDLGAHRLRLSATNYGWGNVDPIARAQAGGDLTSILTNQVVRDGDGRIVGLASRFNVVDVIAEALFETPHRGYPLRVLAEYARNTRAAQDRDSGVWVETEYGDPVDAGSWGVTYTYGWVEQDVTPSAFVFSDMPGTNLHLNMIETSYVLKPGLSLDMTWHLSKRLVVRDSERNHLLSRLHLAAVIQF